MVTVTLTGTEYNFCYIVAATRNSINRSCGVKDAKKGGQSAIETDVVGVVGEFAFCKLTNTFPDLSVEPRSGSCDCKFKGYLIDVKSTTLRSGRLLATTKENPDVDRYVLAIVDGCSVSFPGWVSKDDFINPKNVVDLGHGATYALDQSQLNAWS